MKKKPHPVDVHVGRRLELARQMRGVTQQELGRALSVTFQQVQKYLRGTNRISAGKLYECARFLNVDINFFFEGFADEPLPGETGPPLENIEIGSRDFEIIHDFKKIENAQLRGAIRSLIREVSE